MLGNNRTLDEGGADGVRRPAYFDYDLAGRLAHTRDAYQNSEYYGYDLKGNRAVTTDKRTPAQPAYFTFDALDRVTHSKNAILAITYTGYDQESNRVLALDALQKPAYFAYDVRNALSTTKDAYGNVTYVGYDKAGQTVLRLDQLQAPAYFDFDPAGRQAHAKDAFLFQTYMGYDLVGNLVVSVDKRGNASYFTYDPVNRQADSIDHGQLRTYQVYDAVSNRTRTDVEQGWGRQPWGTSPYGGERVSTYFTFDALNRLESATGPRVNFDTNFSFTYYGYDPVSNRIRMRVENPQGGSDVRESYWQYDLLNRAFQALDPAATTGATPGFQYFGFDAASNRVITIDQEARPQYFVYDAINRESSRYNFNRETWITYYDVRDSATSRIDPMLRWTYMSYDDMGRLSTQSNVLGQSTYFGYDARSSRVKVTSPRGLSTTWSFDLLARPAKQTDALSGVRYFGYDEVGNKTLEIDERGGWTYFAYDQANRTRMVMDQGNDAGVRGQTYFGWDARGSNTMKLDADGRTTYMTYDASARMLTQSFTTPVVGDTAEATKTFTFDAVGNLLASQDETGGNYFEYDKLDRVTKKNTKADTIYYLYDLSGMKTQVTQPSGAGWVGSYYNYDSAGRLRYVAPFAGAGGTGIRPAYYFYDASGLMTEKVLFGNSVMSYFRYDIAGRLQQLKNLDSTPSTITYMGYARDQNGNNTSTAREGGMTIYYAYDSLDRLTQESWLSSAGATVYGFYYNYDPASNRYFQYDYRDPANPVRTYWTYDARNVLTKEDQITN